MVAYAYRFVNDWHTAEDIIQDIFVSLWEKKEHIDFEKPIKPYLYCSIYNRSMNHLNSLLIRKAAVGTETIDELLNREILSYNQYDPLLLEEIKEEVARIVENLPPECKKIYNLSRQEHMKNKEIALLLEISEKAVEKQITKALKEIRARLIKADLYYSLFILLIEHTSHA